MPLFYLLLLLLLFVGLVRMAFVPRPVVEVRGEQRRL
jgi:hypothetical protein